MTVEIYFDAPPGGLDANAAVFDQAEANADASPLDGRNFRFVQRGSSVLVVEYDGPASETGIINAVEAVYGVSHIRTREVT